MGAAGLAAALAALALQAGAVAEAPAGLMHALNDRLLASPSATLTLEAWCAERHLASPARISAARDATAVKPAPAEVRSRLAVSADEPLGYRRVRLACGTHVLSEADNWFVPARLSPEMNATLSGTDTPFGRVVLSLSPHRQTLGVDWLWNGQGTPPTKDEGLFRHRALVEDPTGRPLAYVQETYLAEALTGTP